MEDLEYVEFDIIEEKVFGQAILGCPACGTTFEVDAYKNTNLIWAKRQAALVACCPICQKVQK